MNLELNQKIYILNLYIKEDKDCNNPYLILLINDEQQRDQLVYYFRFRNNAI